MARARRENDGYLAAWTAAEIVRHLPLTATALDPRQRNPFRVTDPEAQKKLDEVREFHARVAIAVRVREAKEAAQKREG